ncbi:hypothetical protein B0H11DRAFT_207379 [Mycena galericulata]|nr:hypothetical protein B0H11DRAFT_207379 [Mycena galericulata]
MDLISYHAKHGPKASNANGATSQKTPSGNTAKNLNGTSQQAPAAASGRTAGRPGLTAIEPVDSDVEEDDSKEVPPEELRVLIGQLRHPTVPPMLAQLMEFNKTHAVECARCIGRNQECRVTAQNLRCDHCSVKKLLCTRSGVFGRWVVRHRFNLSVEKAEEVWNQGQAELDQPSRKRESQPKKERPSAKANLADVIPAEVRTSPRTPVPRIRQEPKAIATPTPPTDTLTASRARPRVPKRAAPALLSGPPRADRKRRKVLAPEYQAEPELQGPQPEPEFQEPEPKPEPEPERASEAGREILAAPVSAAPMPHGENNVKPVMLARGAMRRVVPAGSTRRRTGPRALLSERVTSTETRLDAFETRLQTLEDRVVSEVDVAIGELEGSGDARVVAERLRALRSSLLREQEHGPVLLTHPRWGPSEGLLSESEIDELHDDVQEGEHAERDRVDGEVNDGEAMVVDFGETPALEEGLANDAVQMDVISA